MYKEKFSQMKKIVIENRMEVFTLLNFCKSTFALLEENMLLREKCNRRISRGGNVPRRELNSNTMTTRLKPQETRCKMTIPPAVPSFSVKITKKKAKAHHRSQVRAESSKAYTHCRKQM